MTQETGEFLVNGYVVCKARRIDVLVEIIRESSEVQVMDTSGVEMFLSIVDMLACVSLLLDDGVEDSRGERELAFILKACKLYPFITSSGWPCGGLSRQRIMPSGSERMLY